LEAGSRRAARNFQRRLAGFFLDGSVSDLLAKLSHYLDPGISCFSAPD
jgi:hypothetical protein